MLNLHAVKLQIPQDANIVLGQSHFIKTVEDVHEALVGAVPNLAFGLAFCEASGAALVRRSGTDADLTEAAAACMLELGTGHAFLVLLRDAFPINVLPVLRTVQEVCHVMCATANPVEVIVAETEQGRGILGVVDGVRPVGIETETDIAERKALLRRFGYKAQL
jgi:uncharacterized protein